MRIICLIALLLSSTTLLAKEEERVAVEVIFSPKDHLDLRLVSLIHNETSTIKAAVYCLTDRQIIEALISAKKRGVTVELIVDPFTIKAKAPLKRMARAEVPVYVWRPPLNRLNREGETPRVSLMHNKFCIFSSLGVVWTGSFNFTGDGANLHQENALIIRGQEHVTAFIDEFERIKSEGCISWKEFHLEKKGRRKKR
jgi:phosphatidylserine/phosphatidylglycerophosphate/cardiolipin synthase-like enzyme